MKRCPDCESTDVIERATAWYDVEDGEARYQSVFEAYECANTACVSYAEDIEPYEDES